MATLSDEIKEFIVKGLARYQTAKEIAGAVKENFDVEIERWQVHAYNPNCLRPPAQRWRDLHAATREAHLREVAAIGVSQKAVRLAMLDRIAQLYMEDHAFQRCAETLEQAAKESGGRYDNPRAIVLQVPAPQAAGSASVPQQPLSPNRPGGVIEGIPHRQLADRTR